MVAGVLERLVGAVDAVAGLDLDVVSDEGLRSLLRGVQPQLDRLSAVRARVSGDLTARAVAAAPRGKEASAARKSRQFLHDELHLSPSEAKDTAEAGRKLRDTPDTAKRFGAGAIGQGHAKVITDTLAQVDPAQRDELEALLLEQATKVDPVELGRIARRELARRDPASAEEAARRRHERRAGSVTQGADGGVHVRASLYGLAGERALTAFMAFRSHDGKDERRSNAQQGADALEAIFDAALRTGEAPTQHGVRPHVLVTVPWSELVAQAGVAELGFTGPVTMAELGPLLADCDLTRVVLNADSVPIEVSKRTRYIPTGLWAALVARDGGCAWPGCDAPPAWCQAAHGNIPYRHDGKLKLADAALLCLRHHRRFDHGPWKLTVDGNQVTFHRTDHTDRTDRTHRADGSDRTDGSDRADGSDRTDGADRTEGSDPPSNADPPDASNPSADDPDRAHPPGADPGRAHPPGGDPDRASDPGRAPP